MKIIDIGTSTSYQVLIGAGVSSSLGGYIRSLCPSADRVALVSDDVVFPKHGERILQELRADGYHGYCCVIPHGEMSKNTSELLKVLGFLADNRFTRSDVLIALGGGVVGDLTGFAAAVYMRGIAYFQLPTTLLAAIDSSVGGKTAVDLAEGKNLIGAFWQPASVLCDLSFLETLPRGIFSDGCAEAIKTAVLFDPPLFNYLSGTDVIDPEYVISRCVEHKRDIVTDDEYDTGSRGLLNFGHTLGHAIETCSHYSLSHGRCVAIGMAAVCRAAAQNGFCDAWLSGAVAQILQKFDLPTETAIPLADLMPVMLSDKKRSGEVFRVVVPCRVGKCELVSMDEQRFRAFMGSGGVS